MGDEGVGNAKYESLNQLTLSPILIVQLEGSQTDDNVHPTPNQTPLKLNKKYLGRQH